MTEKTLEEFYTDLGKMESGGNYRVVNSEGFMGKYQMGEPALVDTGYYNPKKYYDNKWDNPFTGKDGVYSKEDFLNNPQAQENAQRLYKQKQWGWMKNEILPYIGKTIKENEVTYSGALGAAHIGGHKGVIDHLNTNGEHDPADANGKRISDYMRQFAGYDVSEITGIKPTPKPEPKIYTQKDLEQMSQEEFDKNLPEIERQISKGLIK